MTFGRILFTWLALAACFLTAGCGGDSVTLSAEVDEPLYREGQQLEKQGRTQEALNSYLKLIAKRGDEAPESHLDAGLIYLYHIKDPIDAIYYFRKYLEIQPNSRHAVDVRGLMESAKREFASTLPAQPLENQSARMDLLDQVNRLQTENNELKSELEALRAGGPGASLRPTRPAQPAPVYAPPVVPVGGDDQSAPIAVVPAPAAGESARPVPRLAAPSPAAPAAPAAPAGRTHAVVKGDTLYNLAQRYYGNRSKWRDIMAANRNQLPNENSPLRIGMVLRIP